MKPTLVILSLFLLFHMCVSVTFTVPPKKEECIFEEIEEIETPVHVNFQVTEGGSFDIDFAVCRLLRGCY